MITNKKELIMYLYNIKYELKIPKGNRKTNTVNRRGRVKEEAIIRFRKAHPIEKILKVKQAGVLSIYTSDAFDKRFGKLKRNKK